MARAHASNRNVLQEVNVWLSAAAVMCSERKCGFDSLSPTTPRREKNGQRE